MISRNVFALNSSPQKDPNVIFHTDHCSQLLPLDIATSEEPHLLQLNKYQESCNSYVTNQLMVFEDMPNSGVSAEKKGKAMSNRLKEFSEGSVTPIVIIEPSSEWGLIDFDEFNTGFYDDWISKYFETIKNSGVTDNMMGTWVPFPEANLPYWNNQNATPNDFSHVVNRYLGILKQYFPQAKGSVLLNSATYETTDFNWESGEYNSLIPYVKDINKEYVDSFGIQGFPWLPNAGGVGPGIFDAAEYLNFRLAIEAADTLEIKQIWFNTGTFSRKYTLDQESTVYVTAAKRKDLLDGILTEVERVKDRGYEVSINIFAHNKSALSEATDWSYLSSAEDIQALASFLTKAESNGIKVSLFDRSE
ncbi:MAG: hypothetical protein WEC81_01005 [Patescibacteria group bacterium]